MQYKSTWSSKVEQIKISAVQLQFLVQFGAVKINVFFLLYVVEHSTLLASLVQCKNASVKDCSDLLEQGTKEWNQKRQKWT